MFKTLCLSLLVASSVSATTRVAVLEFGKQGAVRRTTSNTNKASVQGVTSFWSNLHGLNQKTNDKIVQKPGMAMVPDFFTKADGGLIIGLRNVDLGAMEFVSSALENKVGEFALSGSKTTSLLKHAPAEDIIDFASELKNGEKAIMTGESKLYEASFHGHSPTTDDLVKSVFDNIQAHADKKGSTIIVHLVIEEDEGAVRRRAAERRLENEESGDEDQSEDEEENNQDEEEDNEGDDDDEENNANSYGNSLFYGYSYTLSNGDTYTPYRSIFQIQYFNVVLWSSIGLVTLLFVSISKMMYMPLMPDTLLFGESSKVM